MTNNQATYGDPDRFQIRVGWSKDRERVGRRPLAHGWSMGRLELTVGGVSLTSHRVGSEGRSDIEWYIGPFLHWLARNWIDLLHEEHFSWDKSPAGPAAVACERSLSYWSFRDDERSKRNFSLVQDWYRRHCVGTAARGGLFPDLYMRRFMDKIELSWSGRAPDFSPQGFSFEAGAGVARLDVQDVAEPLWLALNWAISNPPTLDSASFKDDWEDLCSEVDSIRHEPAEAFVANVASDLLKRVKKFFADKGREDLVALQIDPEHPYLVSEPVAVAMFGGLEPDLSDEDVCTLRNILLERSGGNDSKILAGLIGENTSLSTDVKPYEEGYFLAEELLADLADLEWEVAPNGFIDVAEFCRLLDISVDILDLQSNKIRGVALAGDGYKPEIVINSSSPFNINEAGQRFTMAHELCHILYDRDKARGIGHTSGPWALRSVERRANAFAANLLMPIDLIQSRRDDFGDITPDQMRDISAELRVGVTSLSEHLFNIGLIDEPKREELRAAARTSA